MSGPATSPAATELDRWLPPRGPCLICGVPGMDARHRVIDAIADHVTAGEGFDQIADELGLPLEALEAVMAWVAEDPERRP